MADQIEVAAKVEELSTTLNVDIEDVTITIEDGGLGSTVISGADVAEYLTEGEDEQTPTESDDDDNTTEGGDEQSPTETEDTTEGGHLKADGTKCQISEAVEDCHVHSSSTEDEKEDDQTPTESDDEDTISDSELISMGVSEGNIGAVREYRSKNGVCSEGDCPYGANDDSEYCASHQNSSSDSSSSKKKESSEKGYSDLTEGEKGLVQDLISDEGKSFEEAIEMLT
jgi:hypothetical protein